MKDIEAHFRGDAMIKIDLPRPISQNRLFKNKRSGRVCTEEYCTWKWQAMAMIRDQKPLLAITGRVRILFCVGEDGIRADADGDNMIKCLMDALVDNDILCDDNRSIVRGVGMEWVEGKSGATAHIMNVENVSYIELVGVIS